MSLIEVLKNDSDVHVDNNHKVDDDEGHKIDDGNKWKSTVSIWKIFVVRIAVGRLGHKRIKHIIPPS